LIPLSLLPRGLAPPSPPARVDGPAGGAPPLGRRERGIKSVPPELSSPPWGASWRREESEGEARERRELRVGGTRREMKGIKHEEKAGMRESRRR